ncbi:MAG: dehydrogenase [Alphaproteobacteria bacterium]|nr:MAG: dehydrogenase [Alphaproteobacteria bacterium]
MSEIDTRALWYAGPGRAEIRPSAPGSGDVVVETLYSALSRGTERLVFEGRVPESERTRMRAPMQEGDFPFPVKYGYAAVGRVIAGPEALLGRVVFCLHPHQRAFVVPSTGVVPVPDGVPPRRATLAANMETALNAIWDAGLEPGQDVAVIGAGLLGCLVAHLAQTYADCNVTLADIRPQRRVTAGEIGVNFTTKLPAGAGFATVFHTSASPAGLQAGLDALGFEGRLVELSWYGDRPVTLHLGGAFHSQRLSIVSSQVGAVAPSRRGRLSHRDRLAEALSLLRDDRLDALITSEIEFDRLADRIGEALGSRAEGIATIITY